MNFQLSIWRSLKTRVTVMALTVFVLGIWSLAFYSSRMLQADLQDLLSDQQLSTATIVAAGVNQEFVERLRALELVARQITPQNMAAPHTLQALFESRPLLQELFNAGTFVAGADGTAIASVPVALGRVGVNYSDRDHIITALTQNRASVSEPVMGKKVQAPVVSIAAPIRDPKGQVMGVLVGVVNLNQPNFFDLIMGHAYGKSGGYLLVDPRHNRIVTATNKRFNLQALPEPGVNPVADRYAQGYQGHGIFVDGQGVENLSAAHSVPAAGWYVAALLPTHEAFFPIRTLQLRMLLAAALLTLLVAFLTWWMLRKEMAPLLETAKTLAALRLASQFPRALPIARRDEIGQVLEGFNHLLDSLRTRDMALRESEALIQDSQIIAGLGSYVLSASTGRWASSTALDIVFGIDSAYERSVQGWVNLIHAEDRQRMSDYFSGLIGHRELQFDNTYRVTRPSDGATRWVHGLGRLEFDGSGQFTKMNGTVQDITQAVQVEQRLRSLSRITEQAPISIEITDLKGNIEYVNPHFEHVTEYALDELVGKNPRLLQSGQTPVTIFQDLWATLKSGNVWRGEFHNRKKSGNIYIERAVIAPILDTAGAITQYVALKEDITERRRSQLELQASLREKTALLNEVHHRVKNNLQVITSLLRLEAGRSEEPVTKAVLSEMQGRIRSMALVHETLYRSGTFAAVELHAYVQQVASMAFRAHSGLGGAVRLVLNLAPVRVSLDLATPCGLLVNELISNCCKHGFAHGENGKITVELQPADDANVGAGFWRLRVQDTGVGLPPDFETRRSQSLGLQLVADLATQIGGRLVVEQGPGAGFSVTFPVQTT